MLDKREALRAHFIKALWRHTAAAVRDKEWSIVLDIWRARAAISERTRVSDPAGQVDFISNLQLIGWLYEPSPAFIELKLNGRSIYSTTACQTQTLGGVERLNSFRFPMRDVWRYLGAGDALEIFAPDGRLVEFADFGAALTPWLKRKSRVSKLFQRMDDGYAFNKWGKLQKPFDKDMFRTRAIMRQLFEGVASAMERQFGYRVFIFYGTLLGAIRDQNFIGHDDDIDMCYVSRQTDPVDVRQEFIEVCKFLRTQGYHLRVKPFGTKVFLDTDEMPIFGLHYAWIGRDGALTIAYGRNGPPYFPPSPDIHFTKGRIGEFEVDVPVDHEPILEMLYTQGWRVPDPGFSHHTSKRIYDTDYHLTESEMAEARGE